MGQGVLKEIAHLKLTSLDEIEATFKNTMPERFTNILHIMP